MRNTKARKLVLRSETVRALSRGRLRQARGGDESIDTLTNPIECTFKRSSCLGSVQGCEEN